MKYAKKGITLVEIIIVLALLGTVMLVISSFFFSSYKVLNRESNEIDFHREGERAINYIIKEARLSEGIKEIVSNPQVDISKDKTAANITKLVLDQGGSEENGFEVIDNEEGKQLNYYTRNSDGTKMKVELSDSIQSIEIISDKELKEALSIKIKLTMTKGRNPVIESGVYFRNK